MLVESGIFALSYAAYDDVVNDCFKNHAGIPSTPVAFLVFSCLRDILTCPIDGSGGGVSLSRC